MMWTSKTAGPWPCLAPSRGRASSPFNPPPHRVQAPRLPPPAQRGRGRHPRDRRRAVRGPRRGRPRLHGLPAVGYAAYAERRYPTLYLLHGRGDTKAAWQQVNPTSTS